MKNKSISIISAFLLFLMLVSPIAFAAELKVVKVSDLKPGDVIVDKNGNEIPVSSLTTQASQTKTISEIIKEKVFGNKQVNYDYNPGKRNTYQVLASGNSGPGTLVTGEVIASSAMSSKQYLSYVQGGGTNLFINGDVVTFSDGNFVIRGTGITQTPVSLSTVNQNAAVPSAPSTAPPETAPASSTTGNAQAQVAGTTQAPGAQLPTQSNVEQQAAAQLAAENKPGSPTKYPNTHYSSTGGGITPNEGYAWRNPDDLSDYSVVQTKSTPEQQAAQLVAENANQKPKTPPTTYKAVQQKDIDNLVKEGILTQATVDQYGADNLVYSADGAILAKSGNTYTQLSRGSVDTIWGQLSFGWGNIWQGVAWAGAAVGLIQTFGTVFKQDPNEVNALSAGVAAGIFAGKVTYAVLGKGGWGGFLRNADGSISTTGSVLGSPWTAGAIGAGTAWLVYNSMYKKVDSKTETVNFQCLSWQAPHGGADCELCNDQNLPCSEYRCKSLGQSCKLINEGTTRESCINANPRDVSPPVISPDETNLTIGLYYDNVKEMPPGAGFEIKDSNTTTGCIKPYTPITFGVATNEPSQCKIDVEGAKNYSQMATYLGGDSIYGYNHTETLSLPSTSDFANSSLTLENGKELSFFIRCTDANGNANEADYQVKMCVDPSPDTTAPQILGTSINSGSCVAANTDNSTVQFYVNEPATCKWSFDDMNYNQMQNNMSCSTSAIQVNALQVFPCSATLTGIARDGTNFYVRCNDTAGNPNQQSYPFSLKGSNPLKLTNLQPNSTIYGAVRPTPVELYAQTLFGCDNSQAICYYSTTGAENSYVQFFDTNKVDGISTQRLDLNEGSYTYFIKCVDSGGNLVVNTTSFNLQIDTNAPVIARAYEEENYLKIVTPRNSDCVYTNDNCDFLFDEGTVMPYANTTTHVTPWQADKTYFIKCRDQFKAEPTDCSLIVKPTSNFL